MCRSLVRFTAVIPLLIFSAAVAAGILTVFWQVLLKFRV